MKDGVLTDRKEMASFVPNLPFFTNIYIYIYIYIYSNLLTIFHHGMANTSVPNEAGNLYALLAKSISEKRAAQ